MKSIFSIIVFVITVSANAQFDKASLQASGLTCSMCSKAVKNALENVSFVDKVQVDIKNQRYNLEFKENKIVDFDALSKAVEDAGFSVASFRISAQVNNIKIAKDEHILIGDKYFHFLNGNDQKLNGSATFTLVDKQFLSAKDFKKYSKASVMECLQTGKAGKCCSKSNIASQTRIYHVII